MAFLDSRRQQKFPWQSKSQRGGGSVRAARHQPRHRRTGVRVYRRLFGRRQNNLIPLIAGLMEPDHGEILLKEKRFQGPGPERGIVFQNYSLLPWMTVFENVHLAVDASRRVAFATAKTGSASEHYIKLVNLSNAGGKAAARTFRRHAPTGGRRARPGNGSQGAADGRAVQCLDALTRGTLQEELGASGWKRKRPW